MTKFNQGNKVQPFGQFHVRKLCGYGGLASGNGQFKCLTCELNGHCDLARCKGVLVVDTRSRAKAC